MAEQEDAEAEEVQVDFTELAEVWEQNLNVRRPTLEAGELLSWPDPKKVGVCSLPTMSRNYDVLMDFLKLYLPQAPVGKAPYIDPLKEQVGKCVAT